MTNPVSSGSLYPSNYEDHENSWPAADNGDVNSLVLNRRIRDSILQIEKTLGENPQSEEATVDARITTIESKIPYITIRTLGEDVGDYKDLCTITSECGSFFGKILVSIDDAAQNIDLTKEFLFSNMNDDTAGSYQELSPVDQKGSNGIYDFAVDLMQNVNECTIRIRVKKNTQALVAIADVFFELYNTNATITELGSGGSSATATYYKYHWITEESINFTLESPSTDDDFLMLQIPHTVNLFGLRSVALGGGSATFNILSRSTPTASGVKIMTSDLTTDSSGASYYPTDYKQEILNSRYLFLKPYAISGEVTQLMVRMICNRKFD